MTITKTTTVTYKCDRCGVETLYNAGWRQLTRTLSLSDFNDESLPNIVNADTCEDCAAAFEKWWMRK